MKKYVITLTLALTFVLSKGQNASFQFNAIGTNAVIDSAMAYTGRIWGEYLNSAVPIKVNVYYVNLLTSSTLGVTIPNGRRDFTMAPIDSTWYPTSLANSIAGSELNSGEADMDIYMNNLINWYFGTDGNPGFGQYDFVTVFLHEIGHGLGFLALSNVRDTVGSFGDVLLSDIAPLVPSFPFPNLNGKHSVFSKFLVNGSGQELDDTLLFENPSTDLADEFTSNSVYFDGPLAFIQNGNAHVRLYAPGSWEPGSSLQHLNESTFPSGNPNTLMTPFISTGEVHHSPGLLTIAILEDIGWNVNHDVGVSNIASDLNLELFPNPITNVGYIRLNENLQNEPYVIYDLLGNSIINGVLNAQAHNYAVQDFSNLKSGIYFLTIKNSRVRFIKN